MPTRGVLIISNTAKCHITQNTDKNLPYYPCPSINLVGIDLGTILLENIKTKKASQLSLK